MPEALPPVAVVGTVGGRVFGPAAQALVDGAHVLFGAGRHLAQFPPVDDRQVRVEVAGPIDEVVDQVGEHRRAGRTVCVLASGDPGFFGIGRLLSSRFGSTALDIQPAPSSVSLAWAAAGLPWDDADVVSAHGRSLAAVIPIALASPKVAILTDPSSPPGVVCRVLLDRGCGPRLVVVASRLGERDESIVRTDLAAAADGAFDPLSVLLLIDPHHESPQPSISWGGPEDAFGHRAGMITKSEIRAVVLAKLALPNRGVLWDVGAGSGSIGIEAATVAPGLRIVAVERNATDAARIGENAAAAGVGVEVVVGEAPGALVPLPDPHRVFVGGGGIEAVRAGWERLSPDGVLVATFVLLNRALEARNLLGDLVQIQVNRAVPIGGGVRLESLNPVFVCWGRR